MSFLLSKPISDEGLEELQYYEYVGTDASPLNNYIMQPFWRWCIEFVPTNIAPNVITLTGFVAMIAATVWAAYESHNFTAPISRSCMFFTMFAVFFYQTLDALDGKQARRTQNSTPLGQLFDHGCDAVSMCCFCILGGAVLRLGPSDTIFMSFFLFAMISFYMAQWEEYWTGKIELGVAGVTEGQDIGILLFAGAAIWGPDIYKVHAFNLLGHDLHTGHCFLFFMHGAFLWTIFENISRVFAVCNTWEKRREALLQLMPLFILSVALLSWTRHSHIDLTDPLPLLVAAGLYFPASVERMVVFRLTKDPVPHFYPFTIPVFVGTLQAVFIANPVWDHWLVYANAVTAFVAYFHFAFSIIHQITNYFDISAFKINRPMTFPLKRRAAPSAEKAGQSDSTIQKKGKGSTKEKKPAEPAAGGRSRSKSPRARSTSSTRKKRE